MLNVSPDDRIAGVLVPVFALRGNDDLGIGDTDSVKEFADWAASHGLKALQILPVNETGADHSPYNIISSMALDPSTIATRPGSLHGLTKSDYEQALAEFPILSQGVTRVDYPGVMSRKLHLLRIAFTKFKKRPGATYLKSFQDFQSKHKSWLPAYCLFRALIEFHGSEVTTEWPEAHQSPAGANEWLESADSEVVETIRAEAEFRAFVQWIAFEQWSAVRAHCNKLGIALVGDIPVGVSIFSADVWQNPEIFDLTRSSGAPPEKVFAADPFTAKWGQNWGFPLYNWFAMSRNNFAWWRRRLREMQRMFDLVRVDHALGFFRIYSFPWRPEENEIFLDLTPEEAVARTGGALPGFVPQDDSTPENQDKNRRHGESLFRLFLEEFAQHCLIAEDLGEVAPYVRPVLESLEIPGFKIPQWERAYDGKLTPGADYQRLSLATYATHDHPPVRAFWNDWMEAAESSDPGAAEHAIAEMRALLDFCNASELTVPRTFDEEIHRATLAGLMACNSWLVIPMITDILGEDVRYNVPGATGDHNWSARLTVPIAEINSKFAKPLQSLHEAITGSGR